MSGTKNLRKLQIGEEGTAGSAVAATHMMRSVEGTGEDQRTIAQRMESLGLYLVDTSSYYVPQEHAVINIEGAATFEQIGWVFDCSVLSVDGVKDGDGTGYTYTFTLPTTGANTFKSATIEWGDDTEQWESAYCVVPTWTLSGAPGEAWKIAAEWHGRSVATCDFTSLSVPTVEEILFNKHEIWIDAAGSIGSNEKTATLLDCSLTWADGIKFHWGDGAVYFDEALARPPTITLDMTLEYNATGDAEYDAYLAQTARAIRIKTLGSAFATAGTTHTYHTLQIDLYGVYTKCSKIDERDGNDIISISMNCGYDGTASSAGQILLVVEDSDIWA
jgi:hypothetical protein